MIGAHQNLNGSHELTTPLSGMICQPLASNCYDQPATKSEVFISAHYEDIKGIQNDKMWKWGGYRFG